MLETSLAAVQFILNILGWIFWVFYIHHFHEFHTKQAIDAAIGAGTITY